MNCDAMVVLPLHGHSHRLISSWFFSFLAALWSRCRGAVAARLHFIAAWGLMVTCVGGFLLASRGLGGACSSSACFSNIGARCKFVVEYICKTNFALHQFQVEQGVLKLLRFFHLIQRNFCRKFVQLYLAKCCHVRLKFCFALETRLLLNQECAKYHLRHKCLYF